MLPAPRENRSTRFFDRLTRRAAVIGAGAGIAALATRQATAQDATPVTEPTPAVEATPAPAGPVSLLFIQHAGRTTLVPGEGDVHILTLGEVAVQSLYFSDRPNRVTGSEPTESFAAQFSQMFVDSPPNATLIGHFERGGVREEAVVLTLLSAVYDPAAATLTYEVTLLDAEEITDQGVEREPLTVLDAPREYAEVSLFIDNVLWPWEFALYCSGTVGAPPCDSQSTNCCDRVCAEQGAISLYAEFDTCRTPRPDGTVEGLWMCTCSSL